MDLAPLGRQASALWSGFRTGWAGPASFSPAKDSSPKRWLGHADSGADLGLVSYFLPLAESRL